MQQKVHLVLVQKDFSMNQDRFFTACLSVLTSEYIQAIRFTHQRMKDATHTVQGTEEGLKMELFSHRQ